MNKLLLGVLIGASTGAATPRAGVLPRAEVCATRHTVLEFYDLLLDGEKEHQRKLLDKKLHPEAIVDLKHDYLRTGGGDGDNFDTCAIFRFEGTELCAVNGEGGDDPNGRGLSFYKIRGGKLVNVTDQYPRVPDTQHAILPRTGTTIRVETLAKNHKPLASDGRYLYSLVWRNGRFVKTR